MAEWLPRSDAVHWYMQELSSRVVAESGIPSDRHHLGKLILQGFKDAPDFILQIDGATGETETFGSALKRSVQCATAFRKLGLKYGDVVVVMAPNHIHLSIPMYAGFYLGIIVAGIDETLGVNELRKNLNYKAPKVIFCQSERINDVRFAIQDLNSKPKIITFDTSDEYINFSEFLEQYGSDASVDDFKVENFDPAETIALLMGTSGTTGVPKSVAATHKNLAVSVPYMWITYKNFPTPTRLTAVFSPSHWYSALFQFVFSPIIRHTRLQTSAPMTQEHVYYIINKYKPTFTMTSPNMLARFLKISDHKKCDFTCFETIIVGGSTVRPSLIVNMKKASPNTQLIVVYGMTEVSGISFNYDATHPNSLGKPMQNLEHKLVNRDTLEDITEPNVAGELWMRGPGVFKGYYNFPEATAEVLREDGWLRTGDIMYRDEHSNYYYVDRIKLLLTYKNKRISPLEIEDVISKHPGVYEVAVTGVPHEEHGELPVACIVPHENCKITAQEIKDLVKDSLADIKQLRGGVIFLKGLPLTATAKVDRPKLAALALCTERE